MQKKMASHTVLMKQQQNCMDTKYVEVQKNKFFKERMINLDSEKVFFSLANTPSKNGINPLTGKTI
jgi:hypothetical protein